jgi:hypothetical protein
MALLTKLRLLLLRWVMTQRRMIVMRGNSYSTNDSARFKATNKFYFYHDPPPIAVIVVERSGCGRAERTPMIPKGVQAI